MVAVVRPGDEREPRWTKRKESRISCVSEKQRERRSSPPGNKEDQLTRKGSRGQRLRGLRGKKKKKKRNGGTRFEKARRRIGPRMRRKRRRKRGKERKRERRGEARCTFPRQGAWPIGARWAPRVGGDSSAPTGDVITRGRVRRCSLAPPGPLPSPSARGSGPFSSLHEHDTRVTPPRTPRSLRSHDGHRPGRELWSRLLFYPSIKMMFRQVLIVVPSFMVVSGVVKCLWNVCNGYIEDFHRVVLEFDSFW